MSLGGETKIHSIASTVELGKMSSEYLLWRETESLEQYKKQALERDMRIPGPNKELGAPLLLLRSSLKARLGCGEKPLRAFFLS